MSKQWLQSLGLVLVLGAFAVRAEAQKKQRQSEVPEPPTEDTANCQCEAGGASCLFGEAQGCSISCTLTLCECRGASCRFGFPRASRCRCKALPQG